MSIEFKAYNIEEERTLIPTPNQFRVEDNPSYVASIITGVFSPILHLPQIILFTILWPFLKSILTSLGFIFASMLAGVMGRASGYRVTKMEPTSLSDEQRDSAVAAMLRGSGYVAVRINQGKTEETSQERL